LKQTAHIANLSKLHDIQSLCIQFLQETQLCISIGFQSLKFSALSPSIKRCLYALQEDIPIYRAANAPQVASADDFAFHSKDVMKTINDLLKEGKIDQGTYILHSDLLSLVILSKYPSQLEHQFNACSANQTKRLSVHPTENVNNLCTAHQIITRTAIMFVY
jgi:hypothetical protein